MFVRAEKRTKEIREDELERLKRPEERPTAAIDPVELQALVTAAGGKRAPTDDLAIPVEPAVIVSKPPSDDPAPTRQARGREHVERISHASLGMITVEPPRGIAPLPKLQALGNSSLPEPVRFPRASTRQPTLDETAPVRRDTSPIAMFLALAIPGILLAIAYVLVR